MSDVDKQILRKIIQNRKDYLDHMIASNQFEINKVQARLNGLYSDNKKYQSEVEHCDKWINKLK